MIDWSDFFFFLNRILSRPFFLLFVLFFFRFLKVCKANESEGGGVIVVLGEQSVEQMQAELTAAVRVEEFLGTSVVLRQGSPLAVKDLRKV